MATGDLKSFRAVISERSLKETARDTRIALRGIQEALTGQPYVAKSLFDANTILKADSDDTPVALTVAEQSIVGRITSGTIDALTDDEVHGILFGSTNPVDQDILLADTRDLLFNVDGGSDVGSVSKRAGTVFTDNLEIAGVTISALVELGAIEGLTSAANKIIRFTGLGTADLLDFKDEDDMASDSATALASQQSIKAYITANAGITWVQKTANYTTSDNEGILADTTGGGFTVTLPATPTTGDQVGIIDAGSDCGTNNLIIARNGEDIQGLSQDLTVNVDDTAFNLLYDATYGWRLFPLLTTATNVENNHDYSDLLSFFHMGA